MLVLPQEACQRMPANDVLALEMNFKSWQQNRFPNPPCGKKSMHLCFTLASSEGRFQICKCLRPVEASADSTAQKEDPQMGFSADVNPRGRDRPRQACRLL